MGFQSTLPRRERLLPKSSSPILLIISIYTPTKGATHPFQTEVLLTDYFNPHSHEGSDGRIQSKTIRE